MSFIAVGIGAGVSVGTALIGSFTAQSEGAKQRDLMLNIKKTENALQEKIALEEIRTAGETGLIKVYSDSALKYRIALQGASTARLKDTWIYVAGLGAGIGVIYGVFLIGSKSKSI